jgi:phosphatidylglycerophosphatase A
MKKEGRSSFFQKRTLLPMTFSRFFASGLGTGFLPIAPGTWGSLLGLAFGAALLAISPYALAAATLALTAAGVVAIRASVTGPHDDPGWVVIDEIAGQCCALLLLPRPTWPGLLLAFALFRLLDIAKPGPIGWADRRGGAGGVMADDIIAGGVAGVLVGGAHLLWPAFV